MSSGLITSINPPDQHTRKLIIERKAKNGKLHLSEEIVVYLAENLKGDIRKIESIIAGLRARAALLKKVPDLGMVKEIIGCSLSQHAMITAEFIRDFVAEQFKVSAEDLQSKSRKKFIAFPRQISMYLARKLTEQGLSEIGQAFNRDHSTVVHSIRVITDAIVRNGSVRGQVEHLADRINKQIR
jgi:chromosomal replication initiator protein